MITDQEHTHAVVEWVIEHAPTLALILSATTGGIYWWMRNVFTTRNDTTECKIELMAAIKEHENREREDLYAYRREHAEDMTIVRSETNFVRKELAELKSLLLAVAHNYNGHKGP